MSGDVILLLELGLALLLAKIFGEIFERLGQPSIVGEILVGVVLGHEILGPHLGIDLSGHVFEAFATIGIMLLLFLSGLEVELKKLKESGKLSVFVAMGGVILPFSCGYLIGMWQFNDSNVAMLLGAVLTATSVGVTAITSIPPEVRVRVVTLVVWFFVCLILISFSPTSLVKERSWEQGQS